MTTIPSHRAPRRRSRRERPPAAAHGYDLIGRPTPTRRQLAAAVHPDRVDRQPARGTTMTTTAPRAGAVELRFGVTFRTADGQPAAESGPVADSALGALTWALTHLGKPVRDLPHDQIDKMTDDLDAPVAGATVDRGICHLAVHRDVPRIVWDTTDPTYTGPTARLRTPG